MGMFDWYQPAAKLRCPVCGNPLEEWQGKDGPCGLFVWREGVKHPVDHLVSEDVRWPPEEWPNFTLPSEFEIYSYDCPDHEPIDALCRTQDEIWSSTVIQPFRGRPWSKSLNRSSRKREMNLPTTLTQLIEQARRDMREDPMHDLRLGYRLAIYSALGPRADQPDAPDLSGYRRRVFLEHQTAQRLLPIWEKSRPGDDTPHHLLSLAMRVLDGELSVADAWRLRDQDLAKVPRRLYLAKMPDATLPLRGVLAAAGAVLRTATVDIDFNSSKLDYSLDDEEDLEEEGGYRDAAGWGAYLMAGGDVDDPKADASKRREFWEWWLSEAIPAAWQMVQ